MPSSLNTDTDCADSDDRHSNGRMLLSSTSQVPPRTPQSSAERDEQQTNSAAETTPTTTTTMTTGDVLMTDNGPVSTNTIETPPASPTTTTCDVLGTDNAHSDLHSESVVNDRSDDRAEADDDDQPRMMTKKTTPLGVEKNGEVLREGQGEEERSHLLTTSEMDSYNLHHQNHHQYQTDISGPSQSDTTGGKEEEGEGRGLVEDKPVQRPVRTCAVLCLAFFFVYTANLAIQNLQSSLHQAAGLGVTSLAVLYGSIIVFGTLSPLVIRFLNAKRTLVLAFVCHLLYTVSNFYPTFPTLLTSSLLLGAMAGPMWTAQGLYCTATGMAYAVVKQIETHGALSRFNGVFFAFYEATQISGNLIASLVLQRGSYNDSASDPHNKVCGAGVCPGMSLNSVKIEQPEQYIVYILMSIYLACNVAGLLLTILALPPLPRSQEIQAGESSIKKSTTSCLSMLLVPKMLLLLPFFMAQAMNSGILLAEYNEKFVSCSVGIQWVGYVMTVFGVLTAAQAVGMNYAAKLLGRRILFTSAAIADLSVNVAMLSWNPTGTKIGYLFILPCFSGFAEGIFQAQFNSLVAMVFPKQVTGAFATYHTSKATAFTLTFVLARFLCLYQRLYVSLTLSILGLLGYIIVEVMLHRSKQRQDASDSEPKVLKIKSAENEQSR
ncbi:protein unc-93 homolog A-like isoform X2 [Babylonia areolata]|uniref:protein unc-93 homolog A-like isoform X2 n=1 Tax=Babylonia areolata TaxID=304850 RepID=UPI003FCF5723